MLMRLALTAPAVVGSLTLARADGLSPAGTAAQGLCYASGTSGARVPCVLQGQTWTRVLRPTDDASGLTAPRGDGAAQRLDGMVPALDIARSEIGARTVILRSFTASGYAAAGDAGAGARYIRGTSTGPMAVQDAAGTWWQLDLSGPVIPAGWFGVVANDPSKATQNGIGINAAMAALGAIKGGVLRLPAGSIYVDRTLDNRWSSVLVTGAARRSPFDGPPGEIGTTVVPTGAFEVLLHRTPTAAERGVTPANNWKNVGGGFVDFGVTGNNVSPRLLHVTSINYGQYRLTLSQGVGTEAALFDVLPDYLTPSTSEIGGESCNQSNSIDLEIKQFAPGAASSSDGVNFSGYDGGCNTSLNYDIRVVGRTVNGHIVRLSNADNMVFEAVRGYVGGAGKSIYVQAGRNGATGNGGIVVRHLSVNAPAYVETLADRPGSDFLADLYIIDNDGGNGSPLPIGPNTIVENTSFPHYASVGKRIAGLAVGNNPAAARAARDFLDANPGYSAAFNHDNNGGVALSIGSSPYWMRKDGASGDFQFFGPGNYAFTPPVKFAQGVGFNGAAPVGKCSLSAALPENGSAANADLARALNALRSCLVTNGLGQ